MLSKVLRLLGDNNEPAIPERESLNVPSKIARRLEDTFGTARRSISNSQELSLRDGYNGMRYHLDRSIDGDHFQSTNGTDGTQSRLDRYLHLMKTIFILNKVKSSPEYIDKVRNSRNVLWFCTLEDLEEV